MTLRVMDNNMMQAKAQNKQNIFPYNYIIHTPVEFAFLATIINILCLKSRSVVD